MKIKILLSTILVIAFVSCSQKLSPETRTGSKPLVNKEINAVDLVDVTREHTPPLAPNCNGKMKGIKNV